MNSIASNPKILIIRLSSFGDIVQAMSVLAPLHQKFPSAQIDWLVRSDNVSILPCSDQVAKIWSFDRKEGLGGLIRLAKTLRAQGYTHVYDAHSNLRSRIVSLFLSPSHFVRRSKERWKRFLLFKLRINKFSWPYRGMHSFVEPLREWGISSENKLIDHWHFTKEQVEKCDRLLAALPPFIALVPSAAWEMKRWPAGHWRKLIEIMPEANFVLLGGPSDHFLEEIQAGFGERVLNLAGKLSLAESAYVVTRSQGIVSADTGLLHVADLLGVRALALIGPTAFGFPSNPQVEILEVDLPCRPCTKDGRGKCIQNVYQKCMVEITTETVASRVRPFLS